MASTDFGTEPLTGAAALAKLKTLDTDEAQYDGDATLTLKPDVAGKPEFGPATSVYFVNGIDNDMSVTIGFCAAFADRIHGDVRVIHAATFGIPSDLEKATGETLDRSYAFRQPPEEAVAAAVVSHVTGTAGAPRFDGVVHFAAHSRGALVVARGLELAEMQLHEAGYSDAQVAKLFSNVEIETFGGAASRFPEGVRALHYVNDRDAVGLGFGVGPLTSGTAAAVATIGAFNSAAGAFVAGYEIERALTMQPRGPVVLDEGSYEANPVDQLLDAHGLTQYLDRRTPFEQTRDAALGHDAAAEARVAVVEPNVERLRATGVSLPDVVRADPWNGAASTGTIVGIDRDYVAQHLGRGAYATFDVARDLSGVAPPDGRTVALGTDGRERPPAETIAQRRSD